MGNTKEWKDQLSTTASNHDKILGSNFNLQGQYLCHLSTKSYVWPLVSESSLREISTNWSNDDFREEIRIL